MKKPYLKKLDQIADIKVWIVDGQYVRGKMDEEFTNFGQHFRFGFIPLHEFWIDQEHGLGEGQFFIDHLLFEYRLMSQGMAYNKALEKADAVELKERRRAELVRQISKLSHRKTIEDIHKQLLKKYSGAVKVWIIQGGLVRSLYFIDFTEGGHDLVYPHFIPKNEVWLDDDLSPKERRFVLLHELHERRLMGLGWPYFKAHRSASKIEYHCREHRDELEANLLLEIEKNK
ncbi:MAG: hypothetical protein PHI34_07790 [Acidobacteriota bacterium]|nr:hypothetical protein [Acidobacteriota bacterium]